MMTQITAPELLFLGEYLRSCRSTTNFLRSCTQVVTDPQLRSFCDQMAREHQIQEARFGQFLGINLQ
ncbi:MAG: hypothetical protein M0021_10180 [Clostridia bacterium]|nr:hypothetical protein [Clostridia bacterium]